MKIEHGNEDEVCGCGSFEEAIETAIRAVEAAYLDDSDGHMCLMFQMMVTQAVGAICLRGLHIQLNEIVRQRGDNKTDEETRDVVLKAVTELQKHLGVHMIGQGKRLDKVLTDMFTKRGNNPFAILDEIGNSEEENHTIN